MFRKIAILAVLVAIALTVAIPQAVADTRCCAPTQHAH